MENSRGYLPKIEIASIYLNDEEVTTENGFKYYLLIVKDLKLFNLKEVRDNGQIKAMKIRFPPIKDIILNGSVSNSYLVLKSLDHVELKRIYNLQNFAKVNKIFEMKFELTGSTEEMITFQEAIDSLCNPVSRKKSSLQANLNEELMKDTNSFIKKPLKIKKSIDEVVILDEHESTDSTNEKNNDASFNEIT